MLELQEELQAHTQHVLALEQEIQRLQFELQASQNHATGALASEEEERNRCAAELGQVCVCVCVRVCVFVCVCVRACMSARLLSIGKNGKTTVLNDVCSEELFITC